MTQFTTLQGFASKDHRLRPAEERTFSARTREFAPKHPRGPAAEIGLTSQLIGHNRVTSADTLLSAVQNLRPPPANRNFNSYTWKKRICWTRFRLPVN